MYTCYPRGVTILGVWSILPFIIKHMLGIKRIFPCSFGNKCMRLLTRVYRIVIHVRCTVTQQIQFQEFMINQI